MARFSPLRVIFVTGAWVSVALAVASYVVDLPPLHPAWFYVAVACFIAEMTRQSRPVMTLLAAYLALGIGTLQFNAARWHFGNWFVGPVFLTLVVACLCLLVGILGRERNYWTSEEDDDIHFAEEPYGMQS